MFHPQGHVCPVCGSVSSPHSLWNLTKWKAVREKQQVALYQRFTMILQRIFRLSSVLRSAVSVHLRRNIGVTAVAFNKELDPIQKLFVDKIREYKSKRQTSGGPVDTGPEYHQELERELFKLKQMFGKGDMDTFPTFKFEDPKFEVFDKPQS
ncbi:ATP synthase-coupling factor 6 [Cricetulus griseus]|uniref:ATP synthase peripheral stalk subunit F6, mitochondrial n=2 Tax=Cricetulus griseus TaxID=10029 RepID=A0A061IAP6_CRIGR|nr:ATP synthase-coupling factor 6 [Cricetulus griseus]